MIEIPSEILFCRQLESRVTRVELADTTLTQIVPANGNRLNIRFVLDAGFTAASDDNPVIIRAGGPGTTGKVVVLNKFWMSEELCVKNKGALVVNQFWCENYTGATVGVLAIETLLHGNMG